MGFDVLTLAIALTAAAACSLVGVFAVLRKMSMMTDAISHTVLLGIVIGYMIAGNLNSPLLIIGAAAMGVITVVLTEIFVKTKKTTEEAATGAVFPLLFSIAVIIISLNFRGVHIDADAVLLGNIEFAALQKITVFNLHIPKALFIMIIVLLINILFSSLFYKELKVVCFDAPLAASLGLAPALVHYALMSVMSLTAVAAFDAAGSVLVIALMVGPAATALLFTKKFLYTVIATVITAVFTAALGYFIATIYDLRVSGVISAVTLAVFVAVLFLRPKNGFIASAINRLKLKKTFALVVYLCAVKACRTSAGKILGCEKYALKSGLAVRENYKILLTERGAKYLEEKYKQYQLF